MKSLRKLTTIFGISGALAFSSKAYTLPNLKVGLCQILVNTEKSQNIKKALSLIDRADKAELLVRHQSKAIRVHSLL